jgi:hypothetical protein
VRRKIDPELQTPFEFKAKLWMWQGPASWHFLTLPKTLASQLRFFHSPSMRGFGSIKVEVVIGSSTWRTSIFPSKRNNSYVLPVKADVRRAELLAPGKTAKVKLRLLG